MYPDENLGLRFILAIFLKFHRFQPRYSYIIYSYKKGVYYYGINCVKLKSVVLLCARNNYILNSVYLRSLVDFENKSCVRVPLVNKYRQSAWCTCRVWIFSCLKKSPSNALWKLFKWNCSQTIWRAFFRPSWQQWFNLNSGNIIKSGTLTQLLFSKWTDELNYFKLSAAHNYS